MHQPVSCIPLACLAPGVPESQLTSYVSYINVPADLLIPPEQAEYNVLNVYFGGTAGDAPLNYLQIYASDIQYAELHADAPAQVVEIDGATISVSAQSRLDLASSILAFIAEPPM